MPQHESSNSRVFDFLNSLSMNSSTQFPRLSLILGQTFGSSSPTISESSSISSITSSLSDLESVNMTSGLQENWTHFENNSSTPRTPTNNASASTISQRNIAVKLEYSIDGTNDIIEENQISYNGRDLLDLASNIIPYSWQQKTPLTEYIELTNNRTEEETDQSNKIKYCSNCGFCLPPPAPA